MVLNHRSTVVGSHPDVVEEHAEEAAFLYEQRLYLFRTRQARWTRLLAIEERLDAHLDGLRVSRDLGTSLVERAADRGHVASVYLAARLSASRSGPAAALARLQPGTPDDVTDATARALSDEARDGAGAWAGTLASALTGGSAEASVVAAQVIAAVRLPVGPDLLQALHGDPAPHVQDALVGALGALRYPPARSVLERLASRTESPVASLARARLRLGDGSLGSTSPLLTALAGRARDGARLDAAARDGVVEAPTALGVLGDPAHVPLLLSLLDRGDALSATAAAGLRVITGAPLVESVKLPDDPDEPDGDGDLLERLSQQPDDWRAWWAENSGAFQPGVRYRAGRPFAPFSAVVAPVGGLADDLLSPSLRDALADEIACRYGLDAPFRADAFVIHQQAALASLADAATARSHEGEWAVSRR